MVQKLLKKGTIVRPRCKIKIDSLTSKKNLWNRLMKQKLIYSGEMIQAVLSQKLTVKVQSEAIDIFLL